MKKLLQVFLILSLIVLSGCTIVYHSGVALEPGFSMSFTEDKAVRDFRAQVYELIDQPSLRHAVFGIYIEEIESGRIVFSLNADRLFIPASNMKLFTTASCLSLLGPDYRYRTYLFVDGEVIDSVLYGNLIVKGAGDPTISGRFFGGETEYVFKKWAKKLKALGVKRIYGDILGDDSAFDRTFLGYGWSWDDLSYWYAAEIGALSFNDNCVDIFVIPADSVGKKAKVEMQPVTSYISLRNEVITVEEDSVTRIDIERELSANNVRVFGTITGDADTVKSYVAIHNPSRFFLHVFRETLNREGIDVEGCSIDICNIRDYDSLNVIDIHESVPLSEIIKVVNKKSHNFYAEQLIKTLGYEKVGMGTWENGIDVEEKWLESLGIVTDRIFIVDGSGLSRHNLVTPRQIGLLLRKMFFSECGDVFIASLPVGGIDGTLEDRFVGSNAIEHVFAKTGYVQYVRSLSGYVHSRNGKWYLFSIMVNHYPVPTKLINEIQDRIVTLIYNM